MLFESTVALKTQMPIEALLRDDTLAELLIDMHNYQVESAQRRIRTAKDERDGGETGPVEVQVVSESHNIINLAGMGVVTMLGTYREV
jgi:hypothetical protein